MQLPEFVFTPINQKRKSRERIRNEKKAANLLRQGFTRKHVAEVTGLSTRQLSGVNDAMMRQKLRWEFKCKIITAQHKVDLGEPVKKVAKDLKVPYSTLATYVFKGGAGGTRKKAQKQITLPAKRLRVPNWHY